MERIILVEEETPFTLLVSELPEEVKPLELIIFTPAPATPLIVVVKVLVVELLATELMIEEVAETPLTVLVKTLPEEVAEKELIKLVKAEAIPLTTVWKVLVVVERLLEVMTLEVAETPFTLLVMVLPVAERV